MSDDTNKKTVADRIRELRVSQGLTQTDLAKRIGKKDKSSICKIEGKKNDITLKDVARVAEALGTTPAYLMGWEDEPLKLHVDYMNEDIANTLIQLRSESTSYKAIQEYFLLSPQKREIVKNLVHSLLLDEHPEQGHEDSL